MSEKLKEIFNTYAYNPQQKNQLRLADEKHLDLDKIKNPLYDWEQMREIAICMEYGVDPSPLCDSSIPSESMEEIRSHLFDNQGVFRAAQEKVYNQRMRRLIISFLSLFIVFAVVCLGYWQKAFLMSFFDDLDLVLTEKEIDIGLSKLGNIHYLDYVKSYNENGELILPNQKLESVGEYTLYYELKNASKTIKQNLIVTVYDDIEPSIELTQSNISLEYSSLFDYRSYLKKAADNIDGDISSKVTVSSSVKTSVPGTYKVVYTVADTNGNKASATLSVKVMEKETESTAKPNNHLNSSGGATPKPGTGSSGMTSPSHKPASKSFTIDTYSTFDECLEACENYISSQNYIGKGKSKPIKKDGLFIGYQAIFE